MKTMIPFLAAFLVLPSLAAAEQKVALIDPMQAIVEAEEVQSSSAQLETDLKDETEKLDKLRSDITSIEQKLQKEGMTLSEKEKQNLQDERQSKMIEFRSLQKMVQKRVKSDREELLKRMEPKVMEAVREIAEKEGYDLVITKQAALYSKPDMDITGKVTQKLNQMQ